MKKKAIFWLIFGGSFLLALLVIFLLTKTPALETVKRQFADILEVEYIPPQNIPVLETRAFLEKDSIYADFRNKYRFHFQMIGVAQFSDSSRLFLISEPPPHFEIDSIASIFAQFTHSVEVKQHKIGYDGRISDVLILLSNATYINVQNLTKKLSEVLYLSDYKPFTIPLPVAEPRQYFADEDLDYQISLYEFNEWFLEQEERFLQLDDTAKSWTVRDIFARRRAGVYFSEQPGFVAWALPKKCDLKTQLPHIRQFTLDSDLILGGLADSAMLVVIGRERSAPLSELPPLNVESVLLLAAVTEKELSQSLDVNDFLAGKMGDGRDWCPTYLSRELENTEFGHLMTITDILLKNWSERGTIQEANYRYPEPGYYPFDKPLFKKLGLNELVYNWNTTDAMYAIDLQDVTIYTLNRTGALPVSYFSSPSRSVSIGSRYENRAYNYFASLNNTDLARVVQYTALYQLFTDNDITYSGDIYSAFPKNKPYLLLEPTKQLLNIFKNLTDAEINFVADSVARKNFSEMQREKVLAQMKTNEENFHFSYSEEQKAEIFGNIHNDNKQFLKSQFVRVRSLLGQLSEQKFQQLARYLAYPRGTRINSQETYQTMLKAQTINKLMNALGKNNLTILGLDLAKVKNFFVSNLSGSSAKYVKTPSIIVTFNDFWTTGGHNLSSKISRVNKMTNYKHAHYAPSVDEFSEERQRVVAQPAPQKSAPVKKPSAPAVSSGKSGKTTQASAPKTTQVAVNQHNTRPRSAVISNAARPKRGF